MLILMLLIFTTARLMPLILTTSRLTLYRFTLHRLKLKPIRYRFALSGEAPPAA